MSIVLDDEEQDEEYPIATRPATGAVANPFGGQRASVPAAVAVEEQRAITEVKAAIFMARQNLRDEVRAMDAIIQACSRPTLAEVAMYAYARGGTEITGPSIRLAEAMALAWGNNDHGWRELDQSADRSTVQTYAWDLENNSRSTRTFTVEHIRVTKNGSKRLTDPRDRYENMANLASRRERACILAIIPRDVTDAAIAQCEATLRSKIKVTPELIESLLGKFAEFGVTRKALESHIQRRFESITPAQVVALGKKYNSMKDGMSVAADWFEIEPAGQASEGATKADALKAKLTATTGAKAAPAQEKAQVEATPPAPSAAPETTQNQVPGGEREASGSAAPLADATPAKHKPIPPMLMNLIESVAAELRFSEADMRVIIAETFGDAVPTKELAERVCKAMRDSKAAGK